MDYSAFSRHVKETADPAPAYFFFGEEPYLMRRGVEAVAERYGLAPMDRRDGDAIEWGRIAEELAATFLLGPRRLMPLVYRDEVPESHVKGLQRFPAGPTILCAEFWFEKLPVKVSKDAVTIQCDRPKPELLARWARKEFGLRDRTISGAALAAFVGGMRERPLYACLNAIESISCHAVATVETTDVEPFVTADVQTSAFKIGDALAERNTARALEHLRDLLARGEPPLAILGAVAWSLRKVRDARAMRARGQNRIEVARAIGIRYNAERYVDLADAMGENGVRRGFEALRDADALLKSAAGSKSAQAVLEAAVHRLALAR